MGKGKKKKPAGDDSAETAVEVDPVTEGGGGGGGGGGGKKAKKAAELAARKAALDAELAAEGATEPQAAPTTPVPEDAAPTAGGGGGGKKGKKAAEMAARKAALDAELAAELAAGAEGAGCSGCGHHGTEAEGPTPVAPEEEDGGWETAATKKKAGQHRDGSSDHDSSSGKRLFQEFASNDHQGPVALARYEFIADLIAKRGRSCNRVLDLGSGEGVFVQYIRDRCPAVTKLVAADIDGMAVCNATKLLDVSSGAGHGAPGASSGSIQPREPPLELQACHGSFCAPDPRYAGYGAAVCVETIEHLDPGPLTAFPTALLGVLQPSLAVVTTPNADHNVVFGVGQMAAGHLRHHDHRFEWTRAEFREWAAEACRSHPEYTVWFTGVGEAPNTHPDVGHCSQIAVFERQPQAAKQPQGSAQGGEMEDVTGKWVVKATATAYDRLHT